MKLGHSIKQQSQNTANASSKFQMPSTSSSSSRHSSLTNNFDDENDENNDNDNNNDNEFDTNNHNVSEEKPPSNNKIKGRKNSNIGKIMAVPPKARLKNVDRNDVQVEEVTVNNITVVITEFKPKRNSKIHHNSIEHTSPQKSETLTMKRDSMSNKEQKSKDGRKSNNSSSASNQDGKSSKTKKRSSIEMNDHLNHYNGQSSSSTKRLAAANAD